MASDPPLILRLLRPFGCLITGAANLVHKARRMFGPREAGVLPFWAAALVWLFWLPGRVWGWWLRRRPK